MPTPIMDVIDAQLGDAVKKKDDFGVFPDIKLVFVCI